MVQWLDDAVFYQVYPQSFRDSDGDRIGDIPGIVEKLDYIKDLGCNAVWINPCFASPFRDGGYDVSDYYTVAPRYGTNEDLKNLFDQAHKRGLTADRRRFRRVPLIFTDYKRNFLSFSSAS